MTLDELLTLIQNGDSKAFQNNVEVYLKNLNPETFKTPSKTLLMHLASLLETEKIAFVLEKARSLWTQEIRTQFGTQITLTHYFQYINAVDADRNNALIFAARANCLSAVKLLLERGIDMYPENMYSRTALVEAALNLNAEIIRSLILHQPIPKRSEHHRWQFSPLSYHWVMTKREAMAANAFIYVASIGNYTAVELLLPYVHVDAINTINDTALICAANRNHIRVIELLLRHKANINAKNIFGETALSFAVCREYHDLATFLITEGADITSVWERVKSQPFITECLKKAGKPIPPPPTICDASNNLEIPPTLIRTETGPENENNTVKQKPRSKKQHRVQ